MLGKMIAVCLGAVLLVTLPAVTGRAWPWPEVMDRPLVAAPAPGFSIDNQVLAVWPAPLPMRVFRDPKTGEVRIRGNLTEQPDAMYGREADRNQEGPAPGGP